MKNFVAIHLNNFFCENITKILDKLIF